MARTSTTSEKKSSNKSALVKLAEKKATEAARKTATKVAKIEAGKEARKVAAKATIDPDYSYDDESDTEEGYELEDFGGDSDDESGVTSIFSPRTSFATEETTEEEDEESDLSGPDVFAIARANIEKGRAVKMTIKKNGQFITLIDDGIYGIDQLQKDYGAGIYTVILKDAAKGTFIKQSTFSIAENKRKIEAVEAEKRAEKEETESKFFETLSDISARNSETTQSLIDRLLQENRTREEKEEQRRREEREILMKQEQSNNHLLATVLSTALAKKDDGGSMTAILQMMQQSQQQTTTMIMESNKNFMNMISEMRRDTQMMIEKMSNMTQEQTREFNSRLEKMMSSKDKDFDAVKYFEMLNSSREAGMNFGLKINELAKEIAEQNEPAEKAPKGLTETIIENLGKLAPLMLAGNGGGNPQQHFQQQAIPAPRPQPSYQPRPAPRPVAPVQTAPVAPRPQPVARPVVVSPAPTPTNAAPKQTAIKGSVAPKSENATIPNSSDLKQVVIDTAAPLIGHALMNNLDSSALAEATGSALSEKGISLKQAVSAVSLENIYHLAFKVNSLPDVPELRQYLKEYHDYLVKKASAPKP